MRNTGIDFSIGHQAAPGTSTFNGSHYKNEIVSINGVQDFFYGPITTRYRQPGHQQGRLSRSARSTATSRMASSRMRPTSTAHATQDGAAPGRIKFRDVNGDGIINLDDRTIIGNPHPNFTGGLDFGTRRGNFDLSAHCVRIVWQRHLREPEGVLRLPRVRRERQEGSAGEFVDAGQPEREVPAARRERHLQSRSSAATTSRTARTRGCAICRSATTSRCRCRDNCRCRESMCRARTCSRSPATKVSIRRCRQQTSPAPQATSAISIAASTAERIRATECSASALSPRSNHRLFQGNGDDENRIETPAPCRNGGLCARCWSALRLLRIF